MAVRLEPSEHAAWSAVLASSPWRSMAHWCREVVTDTLDRNLRTLGSAVELVDAPVDEVARFVSLCAQLNDRAKGSNRLGRVVADSLSVARAVSSSAEGLLPEVRERESASVSGIERRTKLVNVRLTDTEFERWSSASASAGYSRVSTWVRHVVATLIGYSIAPELLTVPVGLDEVRRQLAGAVTNLAQLVDVAQDYDPELAEVLEELHGRVVQLLRRYHGLGRRT